MSRTPSNDAAHNWDADAFISEVTAQSETRSKAKDAPKPAKKKITKNESSSWSDYYSHIYLAEHLAPDLAKELVRMVDGESATWMRYDGQVWNRCSKDDAAAVVLTHLRAEYERAQESKDGQRIQAATSSCRTIGSARDVLAASTLILSKPKSDFDKNPHLRVVGNGVFDIRAGELLNHHSSLYLTKRMSEFDYEPGFTDENFDKLLDSAEDEIKPWLKTGLFGPSITTFRAANKLYILEGEKRAGKTKILQLIKKVSGQYARRLLRDILTGNKEFAVADIEGYALLTVDELNEDGLFLKNGKVKTLIRTDEVSSDKKGASYVEFAMFGTIVATSNGNPKILDLDTPGADRLISVPFKKRYLPRDEYAALKDIDPFARPQDSMLEVLITTGDESLYKACLAWLLEGAHEYTKAYFEEGRELDLEIPAMVRIATDDWLSHDEYSQWMDAWTVESQGDFILGHDAYDHACQNDFSGTSLKLTGFFRNLKNQNGRFPLTKVLDRTTISDPRKLSQWVDPVKEAQSKKFARYDAVGSVIPETDSYRPRELETVRPRYVILNRRWKTDTELRGEFFSQSADAAHTDTEGVF